MENTVVAVVFVEKGCLSEIISISDAGNIITVDWDVLPKGDCPICNGAVTGGDIQYCTPCKIEWGSLDNEEIAKMFLEI